MRQRWQVVGLAETATANRQLNRIMIDPTDRLLLAALAADARAPLKDLAEAIGLSPPATSERLTRLRERGVIRAFTIDIDPLALGFTLQAIVRVRPMPGALALVLSHRHKQAGQPQYNARQLMSAVSQTASHASLHNPGVGHGLLDADALFNLLK